MSTSPAATTACGPFPCGLTFEALDRHRLLGQGLMYLASGANGNPCHRRWADHPHEAITGEQTSITSQIHRDSTKQGNMRGKVMGRNRDFYYPGGDHPNCYKCDICQRETDRPSDYINSHIIAHAHARTLKLARTGSTGNKRLPTSPSYVCNGLFLCRNCDKHFEDHIVTVAGDGLITVHDREIRATRDYKKLHGEKVVWASEIDVNVDWPTSATLDYRNTLAPVLGNHRKLDFGVDDDDRSTASEFYYTEEIAASSSSRNTRKRARKVPELPSVRGKRARKVA